ncbi:MAG: hypothetical protein WC615_18385 [Mucilaginibacter sp.]|jgi:hypothetical protein|uniref:hypothetical protein n=1 Tax=Mucilaginibacter sp. TaxID=1882438 RepID=UPI003562DED2
MLNTEIVIKRLALIKQLQKIGIEQTNLSETIASFSILSFHDSIEMFLKLLAEYKNIKSDNFNFLDYWTHIPSLTLKESMRNLNARRVNIKHKGLLPSKSDIEISKVNTIDFFEQNTFNQFGVKFKDISLATLVDSLVIKNYLEEAQKALDSNNFEKSIEKSAVAFNELLHKYEQNKVTQFGHSPFFFGKSLRFQGSFFMNIKDRKMATFIDTMKESVEEMQKAIKILSFGIDYKRYLKFNLLTPNVSRLQDETHVAEVWGNKKWSTNNCQYCIDFVIDTAIKLQEFDFDIKEIEEEIVYQLKFVSDNVKKVTKD